jgi:superfamily II DNA or RNA helicase/HKD family nuclease
MSNFITNEGSNQLKTRISELIPVAVELRFLVGFFYFSGIRELIDSLKANEDVTLKVLVGLNVDAQNYGLIEYAGQSGKSHNERREDYQKSIVTALNNDDFDNREFYEQAEFILEQILAGKIIIRKTKEPNHAKLYLFGLKDDWTLSKAFKGCMITGSSNLTKAGLGSQGEFNVQICDNFYYDGATEYFDSLWETATQITEPPDYKEKLVRFVSENTLLKSVHPFDAYMFVVKTWLGSFHRQKSSHYIEYLLEKNGYRKLQYQIDAVTQALSIIEDHGGVILADVVGLGKSIIASLIANRLGKRGIVICPPGIIGDDAAGSGWKKYMQQFELYDWEVRSSGDLDGIMEFMKNTEGIEVIVVDEAHRYRNSSTETYEKLSMICRGKTVILLTATPFNNSPADILSMLRLFIVPKKSNITLSSNLDELFRSFNYLFRDLAFIRKNYKSPDPEKASRAQKLYQALFGEEIVDIAKVLARSAQLSKQIRDVLEPVTIRRNRLDLLNDPDYSEEVNELSTIADPQEWFYELTPEQSEFYDRVIGTYFTYNPDSDDSFRGPIYMPYRYEQQLDDDSDDKISRQEQIDRLSQDNLYDLMRRQVVKRFESSFAAFHQSIVNFKHTYERIKSFIQSSGGRYVMNRDLINKADPDDPDQIDALLEAFAEENKDEDSKKSLIYNVDKFACKDEFFEHIESDIRLFDKIIREIDDLQLVENDPKRITLLDKVEEFLQQEPRNGEPAPKILIFSEYADTVRRLAPYLKDRFKKDDRDRVLVVEGTIGSNLLQEINTNFDAAHDPKKQKNDYDVLLTTDKLSEGFNLNRACMVVNYDIPWNPVRVIQRVGRINRISKKVFDTLHITNFFPTEQGANIVRSRDIASHKMFMIHQTLGEDARIFSEDEEPEQAKLFEKIQTNPDDLEQESFYTRLKKLMQQWEHDYPERVKALDTMPIRIKTAKPFSSDSLVMFIRKGKQLFSVSQDFIDENHQLLPLTIEDALGRIECRPDTEHLPLSDSFWPNYKMLKANAGELSTTRHQQSNSEKAFNFLSYLLEMNVEELKGWRSFLIMLRKDIEEYGTLPEYTLKRIVDWHNNGRPDYQLIAQELETLQKALGKDYLQKVKDSLKSHEKQVIVAIENQLRK